MEKIVAMQAIVNAARELSTICELCEKSSAVNDCISAAYPFGKSLDDVILDMLLWRDSIAEQTKTEG